MLEKAVDLIYYSYLKAQPYQSFNSPDSEKRNPGFTREIISHYNNNDSTNIVITGSKGKGSVANILSNLLAHNYKVGLTTSPHITTFNDRFKINNKIMTQDEFINLSESIKEEIYAIDATLPIDKCVSPMGVQTVIALKYFNENNTQYNIFECGKGVKYDDVNNVLHSIAILNTVFLEHTRELGNTVLEILQDKLSIVTNETEFLYVGNIQKQSSELVDYIKEYISNNYPNCKCKFYGDDYKCCDIDITSTGTNFNATINTKTYNLSIPLYGEHQAENTTLALAVYLDLVDTSSEIISGIINDILKKISIAGRLQVLKQSPLLIVDTCINRESCKEIIPVLEKINPNSNSNTKMNFIICIPDDKDYVGVCELISPFANEIILTKTKNEYYKFSEIQGKNLAKSHINTIYFDNITHAIEYSSLENSCILCTTGLLHELY